MKINIHKFFFTLILLLIVPGSFYYLSFTDNENDKDKNFSEKLPENYSIYAVDIPKDLTFAGEKVPTELIDVRESLDREFLVNTYWQSQTLLFLKRKHRYFPLIERILKQNNIPDDFKYLAVAESGLQNVTSPAGAKGVWQFMKGTAREYNLEVTKQVDERYNLEKATQAACEYFKKAYRRYKSWTLVAASYNVGHGGLQQQLDMQQVDNYYDLLLNPETARYVYRIIAIKTILSNPEKFGFHFREKDLYPEIKTDTIQIDTSILDLASFAKELNINYKILKTFNPWLRKTSLENPSNKVYVLNIPKKNYRKLIIEDKSNKDTTIINDSLKIN